MIESSQKDGLKVGIEPKVAENLAQKSVPIPLQRPMVPSLTRMLAGRSMEEEIIDPANPNLIVDRDG